MPLDASRLDDLVRGRRSSLKLSADREIPADLLAELCELATWAPNHHLTEPWQFAIVTGDGRRRLGDTIADVQAAAGATDAAVAKTRAKYTRAAAVIVVGCAPGVDAHRTGENRDAVAAGIQNLLLGAHARGLHALWSSVATADSAELTALCGFVPGTRASGAIYLGWPEGEPARPRRSAPRVSWIEH